MEVPSSAVTFTTKTVSPTASATWWPSVVVFASSSILADASRYTKFAPVWFVVGVTVTSSTLFATNVVYALPDWITVTPVPSDSALSVASVEAGGVRLPSTLWPDSVPTSAWVRSAASSVATLAIMPVWASPPRLPTSVRSWSPIQMPLSSSSPVCTV